MSDNGRRGKARHIGVAYHDPIRDLVGEPAEPGSKNDGHLGLFSTDAVTDGLRGRVGRVGPEFARHARASRLSAAMSRRASEMSRSRWSWSMNALEKPFSAISHSSSSVKPSSRDACSYSSVSVT